MISNAKDVAAIRFDPRRFHRFMIQPISCDTPHELARAMLFWGWESKGCGRTKAMEKARRRAPSWYGHGAMQKIIAHL
jgi:hypothetical protein